MTISQPRRLVMATVLALCAALGAALLLARHDGAGSASAAASPTARGEFAVLTQAQTAGRPDLFGSKTGRLLAQQGAQLQDTINPQTPYTPDAKAARTRIDASGSAPRAISVAPASNGGVCLADQAGTEALGVVCNSVASVATRALVGSSRPAPGPGIDPDDWNIVALLPDGVSTVTFTGPDGTDTIVKVVDNTVAREVRRPTTMTFDSPLGGTQTQNITPEDAR